MSKSEETFIGDTNSPFDGIACPSTEEGQWIAYTADCICLTATDKDQIKNYKSCGWCPFFNKGLIGNEKGQLLNMNCPASASKGQWTYYTMNYKCLTATSCSDIGGTNCGWCPSLKKAY